MPALEVGIRSLLQGLPDRLRSLDNKLSKLVVFQTPFQTLSQPWLLPASPSGMAFYAFSPWTTSAQLVSTLPPLSHGPFSLETQQNKFILLSSPAGPCVAQLEHLPHYVIILF